MRNEGQEDEDLEELNPLRIADVCEEVRDDATSRGRTRTGTGITPRGF